MYETPNGRRFTLSHHSLADWADQVERDLTRLGVNEQAARRFADEIRKAVRV